MLQAFDTYILAVVADESKKPSIESALVATVKLFLTHPPYKLTYSKISRSTGIPRSTLYYYFGSKVEGMLTESARFALKKFLHLETVDVELKTHSSWEAFQEKRLLSAIEQVDQSPWAPRVYMMFRDDAGPIGDVARELEGEYLKEMTRVWKYYHPDKAMNHDLEVVAHSLKMGFLWGMAVQLTDQSKKGKLSNPREFVIKLTALIEELLRS